MASTYFPWIDLLACPGLRIGPSNARKRDVPSMEWASSLPHKLRLQDLEHGRARFSPSYPEESDRLRLMQVCPSRLRRRT